MEIKDKLVKHFNTTLTIFSFQPICHMCGGIADNEWLCEKCGQHYCERCSAPYTIHTQIDYNCCQSCYEDSLDYFRE